MVYGQGSCGLFCSSVVNTSLYYKVLNETATSETILKESKLPEASALPPYTLSSLISDFGDWLVSFIWTGNTEGNPLLCGHGIEWELF